MSFFQPSFSPGDTAENAIEIHAVPGLMTLLDVTLLESVEGQLTATLTSSHALLLAWLDLKRQAITVLQALKHTPELGSRRVQMESFARACLDAACSAVEALTLDKLAQSANLSDPYEGNTSSSSSSAAAFASLYASQSHHFHHHSQHQHHSHHPHHHHLSSPAFLQALNEASLDTGRRTPRHQRAKDCWESPRLHCPDYVWADDASMACQKLLRQLLKHSFNSGSASGEAALATDANFGERRNRRFVTSTVQEIIRQTDREAYLLQQLLHTDLPTRLMQFRAAMEADSVVTKRLYLVKCEYRASFRAFLEAHHSVLKAPSIQVVEDILNCPKPKITRRRTAAKDQFHRLLESPQLREALALEQVCEEYEIEMARSLYSFCELARFLDQKRARLKLVPGVLIHFKDLVRLQDRLVRLRSCLSRKAGPDMSTGIRPILIDLQGIPRDDEIDLSAVSSVLSEKHSNSNDHDNDSIEENDEAERQEEDDDEEGASSNIKRNVERFVHDMEILIKLCEARNSFHIDNKKTDVDLPTSIVRGTAEFDGELFCCQFLDWYDTVIRQDELTNSCDFEELAEKLRQAEIQMSLTAAPMESLEMVRERVEMIALDRGKRFQVLKEMIEEVCVREMNLHVHVIDPPMDKTLVLQPTSSLGVFGLPLLMAGETLPIG